MEEQYAEAIRSDPFVQEATELVRHQLMSELHERQIPRDSLDSIKWKPNTSAGYSYIGKKSDNYYVARKNATRAIYDYEKWQDNYRFTPNKAFARSQLADVSTPKIRHVWGQDFHNLLVEGLTAQPLIEKLAVLDSSIYIGRDLHKDLPHDIIRLIRDESHVFYGLDFSGFDAGS